VVGLKPVGFGLLSFHGDSSQEWGADPSFPTAVLSENPNRRHFMRHTGSNIVAIRQAARGNSPHLLDPIRNPVQ
jgi:hypothetical protein